MTKDVSVKLGVKHKRLLQFYAAGLDGRAAGIKAGYSKKYAAAIASQLVNSKEGKAYLETVMAKAIEKSGLTADRVLEEDIALAFSDACAVYNTDGSLKFPYELPPEVRRAIKTIRWKTINVEGKGPVNYVAEYQFYDKHSALDRLHRHLGLAAAEKHELSGNVIFDYRKTSEPD